MEDGSRPAQGSPAPDDLVQPFHIEGQPVMGRLVRLGPLVDEVLRRHDYPPEVATLLAEMLALAAGLSSLLKYQGIFTLQVKLDGLLEVRDRLIERLPLRDDADFQALCNIESLTLVDVRLDCLLHGGSSAPV